ncbi:MAG: protein O-mannosyl-transferase family [Flavobacteriales bacterium]
MSKYKLINNITGWLVLFAASFVYVSTIEPTASWWDCGEYISASYKLMVGHEPGAPMFQLLARFFSLFAGDDVTQVAKWVNTMSAMASAFTILFLFWSITHFAKKIVIGKSGDENDTGNILAVMGSGVVGALAFTFSDSFWFSAVEGEVYALSSMFTAMVFWVILKWESVADEPHADRYIVLIALLFGMSIGVHLLNLLAIPAITFVYYFRKYKPTTPGFLITGVLSLVLLVFVQYGIIPYVVKVASWFELMFVNGFGLPFNSGVLFYAVLLVVGIVTGLYFTRKLKMFTANTAILSLMMLLIGYSAYTLTVVRSMANPPMDESNPDNVFALQSYLNREQYGDRPLFYGQYFNADYTGKKDGADVYYQAEDSYKISGKKSIAEYDKKRSGLFPRMYSSQAHHVAEYKSWTGAKGGTRKPTAAQNISFLWNYQIGHMYMRYFLWNFAGRQNDIQGHGEINKGNWISGIPFIDEMRLGPQDNLPITITNNKAHNKYYMLPLLLGLIGLVFQFYRDQEGGWLVMLMFIMTGLAIVIYLNQYPYQPRERDYAYVGSFYAFAMWIGLGVAGIHYALKQKVPGIAAAGVATVLSLVAVPYVMAKEGWDDHDRSNRYAARDIAVNYLESCAPNAILFTNGDNDTFPLWYAQEVEGVRTDIRVVNLSLFNTNWYIDQLRRAAYDAAPLPFTFTEDHLLGEKRLQIPISQNYFEQTFNRSLGGRHLELRTLLDFVRQDDPKYLLDARTAGKFNYLPTGNVMFGVDSAQVIKTGTVRPDQAGRIVKQMKWKLSGSSITRNHLMVLDLIANTNWERPIYFAVTVGSDNYLGLEKYFQIEGLAYRLVPIEKNTKDGQTGEVNTVAMYENMVNKFQWGNMHMPEVYHGTETERMSLNYRSMYARLANALIDEGKKEEALKTLDKCMEAIPHESILLNFSAAGLAEAYYKLEEYDKANDIARKMTEVYGQEMDYYTSLDKRNVKRLGNEPEIALSVLQKLMILARVNDQEELLGEIEARFDEIESKFLSSPLSRK